jgi:hypothetical protein
MKILFWGYYIKAGSYSLFTIPSSTDGLSLLIQILLHGESGYDEKKDIFVLKCL